MSPPQSLSQGWSTGCWGAVGDTDQQARSGPGPPGTTAQSRQQRVPEASTKGGGGRAGTGGWGPGGASAAHRAGRPLHSRPIADHPPRPKLVNTLLPGTSLSVGLGLSLASQTQGLHPSGGALRSPSHLELQALGLLDI